MAGKRPQFWRPLASTVALVVGSAGSALVWYWDPVYQITNSPNERHRMIASVAVLCGVFLVFTVLKWAREMIVENRVLRENKRFRFKCLGSTFVMNQRDGKVFGFYVTLWAEVFGAHKTNVVNIDLVPANRKQKWIRLKEEVSESKAWSAPRGDIESITILPEITERRTFFRKVSDPTMTQQRLDALKNHVDVRISDVILPETRWTQFSITGEGTLT